MPGRRTSSAFSAAKAASSKQTSVPGLPRRQRLLGAEQQRALRRAHDRGARPGPAPRATATEAAVVEVDTAVETNMDLLFVPSTGLLSKIFLVVAA
ncbi:Hypothetical predicted protein, partial [Marmota monax]